MVQLKNSKWLILILSILLLSLGFFLISKLIFNKNNKEEKPQGSARIMTTQEKQEIGINENINAEVIKDRDGMFLYKITK